jgi:hypothetical protein
LNRLVGHYNFSDFEVIFKLMSTKQASSIRRSRLSENVQEVQNSLNMGSGRHKNLLLGSLDSSCMKSLGIPGEETLEEALIDLYLSVKIRSNDEVRRSLNNILD